VNKTGFCGLVLMMVLAGISLLSAQADFCKLLDREASRMFVPDRIPMETELLAVDSRYVAALQFPDQSRLAFVAIATSGLSAQIRARYQYVLISEARLQLGGTNFPPGMVGFGLETTDANAVTGTLVAREVGGREIDRLALRQDPEAKSTGIFLMPRGPKEFELRIGKYIIQGAQR
jgi:hypothetical protein